MSFLPSLSFTKKYIFALSLIATFSILAYFNLTSLTQAQEDDGEMINISGKQRMYSQKIALYSLTDRVD
ncbi:MAG: type IV pili methyl-accepting chemotaxis transducer N-terminal domain-containing protein, partial [Campylobacterota bacterium]|nr:type IV pili methyl-accepting chemotaxis transducer N-terminal domain-containing protein [Campylobacterota bacterium]